MKSNIQISNWSIKNLKELGYASVIISFDQYISTAFNFILPFIFAKILGEVQFNHISHLIIFFGFLYGLVSSSYIYRLNYINSSNIDFIPRQGDFLSMILVTLTLVFLLYGNIDDIYAVLSMVGIYLTNILFLIARKKIYLDETANLKAYFIIRLITFIVGVMLVLMSMVKLGLWIIILPSLFFIYLSRTKKHAKKSSFVELFHTKHVYHFIFSYFTSSITLYTYAIILSPDGLGDLRLIQTFIGGGAILVAPIESIFSRKYQLHVQETTDTIPKINIKFYLYSITTLAVICTCLLVTLSWFLPWLNISLFTGLFIILSWSTSIFIIIGTVRERTKNRVKKLFVVTLVNQLSAIIFLLLARQINASVELTYVLGIFVGLCISALVLQVNGFDQKKNVKCK